MRTKLTLLNALTSVVSMIVSSILSLVSIRVVLVYLGSDYNGLNSTINQFITVLMLVESGFTLAALVRLYAPYGQKDYDAVNKILSKTRVTLKKVGFAMFVLGIVGSCIYALLIDSEIDYIVMVALFSFSVAATAFNFAYVYKYRLVFQVTQHEYILYAVNILQYIVMYGGMIAIICTMQDIVLARLFYMLANIGSGFLIAAIAKKQFPFASYTVDCSDVSIDETKDLFVSKIVSVLYNSLMVFYMSVFVGTAQTSVYAVYNSVVSLISNFINTALIAPQNALGQIINTEKEKAKAIVHEYEFTAILIAMTLFSTTMALILPFVRVYTAGVGDVDYIQPLVAILLVVTGVLQIIHIPSGRCIELSGDFRAVRNIQLVTFILLAVLSVVGALWQGLVGLLLAKLLTNVMLAAMEIIYAHKNIIQISEKEYLKILVPYLVITTIVSGAEYAFLDNASLNWVLFIIIGVGLVLVNSLIMIGFGILLYKNEMKILWNRYSKVLHLRKQASN